MLEVPFINEPSRNLLLCQTSTISHDPKNTRQCDQETPIQQTGFQTLIDELLASDNESDELFCQVLVLKIYTPKTMTLT
jgi:hypothetical protein